MAKFITVLDSNMGLSFWEAVQRSNSLSDLQNNLLYNAQVNQTLPKNADDVTVGNKRITEINTQTQADATMIQLSMHSQNLLALASGKASKKVIATLLGDNNPASKA